MQRTHYCQLSGEDLRLTFDLLLITRETVDNETPAFCATSFIVGDIGLSIKAILYEMKVTLRWKSVQM